MGFSKAKCTECGSDIVIDDETGASFCPCCNTEFFIEEGISRYEAAVRPPDDEKENEKNILIDAKNDFEIVDGVLKSYKGKSATVNIPEGVVGIDEDVFRFLSISEIRFPSTLKELWRLTLDTCPAIIDLGDGLERVNGEILNCFFLNELRIGKSLIDFSGDCGFFNRLQKIVVSEENKWCKIENGCLICGGYSSDTDRIMPYNRVLATIKDAPDDITVKDVPYILPKAFNSARRLSISGDCIFFDGAGLNSRILEYVCLDAKSIKVINDDFCNYAFNLDGGNIKIVFGSNIESISGNLFNLCWINKIEIVIQSDIRCDAPPIKNIATSSSKKIVIGKNVSIFDNSIVGNMAIDRLSFDPDCAIKTIENIVISQKVIELPDSVEKFSFIPVGDSEEYTLVVGKTLYKNLKHVISPEKMGNAIVRLRGTNKQRKVNGFRLF